jgi:hypothetical protein
MATCLHIKNCNQDGGHMIRIKVEYDAYNRRFKLLDREFGSILQDGETYELTLPFMLEELGEESESLSIPEAVRV